MNPEQEKAVRSFLLHLRILFKDADDVSLTFGLTTKEMRHILLYWLGCESFQSGVGGLPIVTGHEGPPNAYEVICKMVGLDDAD